VSDPKVEDFKEYMNESEMYDYKADRVRYQPGTIDVLGIRGERVSGGHNRESG
jgi:hypothetical protein